MFDALAFLVIDINIDPDLGDFGSFTLSWHGLFSAVGIVGGVWLAVRLATKNGIPPEIGQEIAIIGVIAAIIGARLFFVFEHWDQFSDDIPRIVTGLNEGGITLYGGLLGGAGAGLIWGIIRKYPLSVTLDAAAPGMILGQAIGRIGDLINGEHLATTSDLPWAVRYTHPDTLGELGVAVHPTAGGYELLGDFVILGVLLLLFFRYLKTPGWVFASYMIMYGALRFGLSEFRIDEQQIGDVPVPQVVSVVVVGIGILLLGVFRRWPGPITREYAERVWGETGEEEPASAGDRPSTAPSS